MNASILIAAISVGFVVLVRLIMGTLAFLSGKVPIVSVTVPTGLGALILIGILMGHRLAWQWGRILGLFGGIVLSLLAVHAFSQAGAHRSFLMVGVLLTLQGLPLFPMFFALGTRQARQHFRLICPQCGSGRPRGGDFLFTKAICKECDTSWD